MSLPTLPLEINSVADFHAALQAATQAAVDRGARAMWWVDPDFASWPLDDPALIDRLTAWLRLPLRQLVLLADDYAQVERRFARFKAWRVDWSHAIDPRTPGDLRCLDLPTVMLDDGPVALELWDREGPHGRARVDAAAARAARDRIDAALQRSSPSWPVKPLGL